MKNAAGDASQLTFALNPASDNLSISASGISDEIAEVTIYDNAARRVKSGRVEFRGGSATYAIADLRPGSYTCVVNTSKGRLSGGFMKR